MAAAFVVILGLGIMASESLQTFRSNSNGNPEYVITFVGDCTTGLRDSGFAYAPTGGIMLKQVNKDGTVGDVCTSK
ncbi:MAG: hypothetical protein CMM73_00865 [Rhodospirillaceae bacterium]|nr:hypothetical protein [Rhodospirillaceae bacterium]|tara:strand:+ start:1441 stop:1668 length:228 start_codon:yes stop_codon:yes gene_type:complete